MSVKEALERATFRFAEGRRKTLAELGDFAEIRARTRTIKERALENAQSLWFRVYEELSKKDVEFFEAETAEDARRFIYRLLEERGVRLLVKGKSITSEEIGINPYLEVRGIEVVETDLGERIIQLKGEKPSHLIVPAVHNTKEEVAELFSRYFDREVPPDPFVITKLVRADLRERFLGAQAGFTGINVVSADPAAFYLMTNEGNGRLCATVPPLYVTLVGYEKIVEGMSDALWILRVLPRNSVGLRFSSYVSIFRGPFRWRDDRRWVVVVLNNGRKKALSDPVMSHALRCIRCGACMNVCPVYRVVSGLRFSRVYMGGIGVAWTAITEGVEAAYRVARWCTGCKRCEEVCPVEIPISRLVEEVRARADRRDLIERVGPKVVSKRDRILLPLSEAAKVVGRFENRSPVVAERGKREGDVHLYLGCLIDQMLPDIGVCALDLLESSGTKASLDRELCCGLPARVYGDRAEYFRLALANAQRYEGRPVVFVCDTCMSAFAEYEEDLGVSLRIYSLAEWLLDRGVVFEAVRPVKVALHIPCHLIATSKQRFLEGLVGSIRGVELLRDDRESECCGGAGLYRYKKPDVSRDILEKKVEMVRDLGPDVVVTTCPSCLLQLKDGFAKAGLRVEVLHLAQFLVRYTRWESPSSESCRDTGKQGA